MTNAEKFKEIFGFGVCCMIECKNCPHKKGNFDGGYCDEVKFWASEYKGVDIWDEIIKDINDEIEKKPKYYSDAVLDAETVFNGIEEVYEVGERHGLEIAIDFIKKHLGEVRNE